MSVMSSKRAQGSGTRRARPPARGHGMPARPRPSLGAFQRRDFESRRGETEYGTLLSGGGFTGPARRARDVTYVTDASSADVPRVLKLNTPENIGHLWHTWTSCPNRRPWNSPTS